MAYPIIDETEARIWWRTWNELARSEESPKRCDAPPAPKVREQDLGREYDWDHLASELVSDLQQLLTTSQNTSEFEAAASVLIHKKLPFDVALSDPEFWTWFAIGPGLPLVLARYGETEKSPIPGQNNFTSPNGKETLFYRLWLRADIAIDKNQPDPYWLAKYGDVDFWRSHVFRQNYAEHRDVVAALAQFQYPDGPGSEPKLKGKNQSHIRALVKYLKRGFANINVEMFDEPRSKEYIETQWQKVVDAGVPE